MVFKRDKSKKDMSIDGVKRDINNYIGSIFTGAKKNSKDAKTSKFLLFHTLIVVFLLLYAAFGFYYCIFEGNTCSMYNYASIPMGVILSIVIILPAVIST
jgi:hypothetical protein